MNAEVKSIIDSTINGLDRELRDISLKVNTLHTSYPAA